MVPVLENEQILDGVKSLEAVLVRAGYRTLIDRRLGRAVAEHTVFLHPETVAQAHGEALFPVTRTKELHTWLDGCAASSNGHTAVG